MLKITKISNFLIESQRVYNKDTSYPEEGAILYQGFLYNFIMSHKLEEGYSYYVYDHDNVPIHSFSLILGEENNIRVV